jgi:hypothetical protein
MDSFSSTPEIASLTNDFTSSTEEKPEHVHNLHEEIDGAAIVKPTRRLPSKGNKLTVSHSN